MNKRQFFLRDEGDQGGDGGTGSGNSKTELTPEKIDAMTPAELATVTKSLLESKREANNQAKSYREKFEELDTKVKTEQQKQLDAEKSLETKLAEKDALIEQMKVDQANKDARYLASEKLVAKGFDPKIVTLAVKDITADNMTDAVKQFEKDYDDDRFKIKPKDDGKPGLTTKYPSNEPKKQPAFKGPLSQTAGAFKEMREGGVEPK